MLPDISLWQALAGAGVLVFCSALQASVGFGFSLFAVPLLLMALKLPLPCVVAISLTGSTVQRLVTVAKLRDSVAWRGLLPLMAAGIVGLPAGTWLLRLLTAQSRGAIRQWVGGIVLAAVVLRVAARPRPRASIHAAWGYLAAFASGILNGLANIGGPPMVLWTYSHDWPRDRLRVTILAFTLPMVPFQLALLILAFGRETLSAFALGVLFIPAFLLGSAIGIGAGSRISVKPLRLAAMSLLALIGLFNLLQPWLRPV